jgi:rhodanese-related sulfurtransferase
MSIVGRRASVHFHSYSAATPLNSTDSELRITPEKAKAMVKGGQALFLDVVSSSVYPLMSRAIAGAIRIAPEELADRVEELPKSTTIVTYCT